VTDGFDEKRSWPQLVHIATDGETYGHHHRHGDMALAYALEYLESTRLGKITNYGEYLELHPPTYEVEILENTSWSCSHGVERWRTNCGCTSGGHSGWNQEWRRPLRQALDWLRDDLLPCYEEKALQLFDNPWVARNDYIDVILDRSLESVEQFFERHCRGTLSGEENVQALKLLELQRHAMLVYTSCGWFFDELSGIETVQVIQYAVRALQLSQELFDNGLEDRFLDLLEEAKGNIPEHRDGRLIYEKFVKPTRVDLLKAGAHYAVSCLFEDYGKQARIFCYTANREDYRLLQAGKIRLLLGNAFISSEVTRESCPVTFGVVHMGDHIVSGGVRRFRGEEAYQSLVEEVSGVFAGGDIAELLRVVDRSFGLGTYSLRLLFRDQQRKILRLILDATLLEAEAHHRRFYEDHSTLMRYLADLGIPLPAHFKMAAEFILNMDLRRAFEAPSLDRERIHQLVTESRTFGVALDHATLEFALRRMIERMADQFSSQPEDLTRLQTLESALDLVHSLPFEMNLWKPQNAYYQVLQGVYPKLREQLRDGAENLQNWVAHFTALAEKLRVRIPQAPDKENG